VNERGYPNGPIRIYDSGVHLYLEPSQEEASKFDVVFNVAKEVANPFKKDAIQTTVMSVWKAAVSDESPASTTVPETGMSEMSFKSAVEFQVDESPTTPRADKRSEPEYIHVPWDHNSEILDDLYTLCQMIDERISQGKSVLIHCQLGVSRSASLVIAYGLYKNPDMDFNSIYSIVKERSCWVGPNMSLIYQLTDFRSRVRQGGPAKEPPEEWFREPPTPPPSQPQPQQQQQQPSYLSNPITLSKPPVPIFCHGREQLSDLLSPTTLQDPPHPTLKPPSFLRDTPARRPHTSTGPRRNMALRPLPLREKYDALDSSFRRASRADDVALYHKFISRTVDDVPPTPNLFSPKAMEYLTKPCNRNSAGDLAIPRMSMDATSSAAIQPPVQADPRSPQPQQRREPIIMRNIDEFL
jgi:tyrosine-protein phosphatase